MGVLKVVLERISHLRDEDYAGKTDPYVQFHLEQDNRLFDKDYGTLRSTGKGNDCNPEYNETFTFNNVDSLDNLELHVSVYDEEVAGKDDKVGGCTVNLEKLKPSSSPVEVEQIIDSKGLNIFSKKARVHLKISYTH